MGTSRGARAAASWVLVAWAFGSGARGDPTDADARRAALAPGARSVVPGDNLGVFAAPDLGAPMVGRVASVAFPIRAVRPPGNGCRRAWFAIGPAAWLCGVGVDVLDDPAPPPASRIPDPMTWDYRVSTVATVAYGSLEDAASGDVARGEPWARWQGFALRAVHRANGQLFAETRSGQFLARAVVASAPRSGFRGVTRADLTRGLPGARAGWVLARRAAVHATPELAALGGARSGFLEQRAAVRVLETRAALGRLVARLEGGRWVRASSLRIFTPAPLPADLGARERWIDVDLDQQVMAAYEGDAVAYVTLTSSGADDTPTPTGTFRIWSKRISQAMGFSVSHAHVLAEVPYVQFFDRDGRALHGVYWHGDFGRAHSHGCLNLSFEDARWMFEFTSPQLPDGWRAVVPADPSPGTRVRVRRGPATPPPATPPPATPPARPAGRRHHHHHHRHHPRG